MISKVNKNELRVKRHIKLRHKLAGTTKCPRLCVYRSLNNIYAQIIDDTTGTTLVSASTLDESLKANYGGNKEAAKQPLYFCFTFYDTLFDGIFL